jgi:hypothetical protein
MNTQPQPLTDAEMAEVSRAGGSPAAYANARLRLGPQQQKRVQVQHTDTLTARLAALAELEM